MLIRYNALLYVLLCTVVVKIECSTLMQQLSLIFRDTYLVYGLGRRSERDLPVCESLYEACNLSHKRMWLTPITERLCRCDRRGECPVSYEQHSADSQHVSNRAQYKFCEGLDETVETCPDGQVAVELLQEDVTSEDLVGFTRQAILQCKCPWPNSLVLNKTTQMTEHKSKLQFTCNKLPPCQSGDVCGLVRMDTFEVYYQCSCLQHHLCTFDSSRTFRFTSNLPHFNGDAYEAFCHPL